MFAAYRKILQSRHGLPLNSTVNWTKRATLLNETAVNSRNKVAALLAVENMMVSIASAALKSIRHSGFRLLLIPQKSIREMTAPFVLSTYLNNSEFNQLVNTLAENTQRKDKHLETVSIDIPMMFRIFTELIASISQEEQRNALRQAAGSTIYNSLEYLYRCAFNELLHMINAIYITEAFKRQGFHLQENTWVIGDPLDVYDGIGFPNIDRATGFNLYHGRRSRNPVVRSRVKLITFRYQ